MPSSPDPTKAFASGISPLDYRQSPLHQATRDWPQTNCYVDLWIEALSSRNLPPEAMLGFTARLDFEGDQFTFFKPPLGDIESLYGLVVNELSLFDDLAGHIVQQCARERLVMIEVDGLYLPDTRGVSYQTEHSKTTIGVNYIDPVARRIDYFHNDGYFRVEGDDYDGVMAFGAANGLRPQLPPYAEIVKADSSALDPATMRLEARRLLQIHAARRPPQNPITAFAAAMPDLIAHLRTQDPAFFHKFAFNTVRQLGANFELMASCLTWLDDSAYIAEIDHCKAISAGAKSLQFLIARAIVRQKTVGLEAPLAAMAKSYDMLFSRLDGRSDARLLAS